MTLVGLIGGKDMGPSIGCIAASLSGVLMVFIRALTEVARSIFLLRLLDCYWSSVGPLNMKLMVDRGFRWVFSTSNCSVSCEGSFCFASQLPNVPFKVPRPDQFFY